MPVKGSITNAIKKLYKRYGDKLAKAILDIFKPEPKASPKGSRAAQREIETVKAEWKPSWTFLKGGLYKIKYKDMEGKTTTRVILPCANKRTETGGCLYQSKKSGKIVLACFDSVYPVNAKAVGRILNGLKDVTEIAYSQSEQVEALGAWQYRNLFLSECKDIYRAVDKKAKPKAK